MKKIPRDLKGYELAKIIGKAGYQITRQTGSHIRLTTNENGIHHITIPNHSPLKIGTLSNILSDIAEHLQLSKKDLLDKLF
jgi:predicted RNA binding protein YcfA (HicA-like mRNA interferase family)